MGGSSRIDPSRHCHLLYIVELEFGRWVAGGLDPGYNTFRTFKNSGNWRYPLLD